MMGKFTSLVQGINRLHNQSKKGELTEYIVVPTSNKC